MTAALSPLSPTSASPSTEVSSRSRWGGRIVTGLVVAFLTFDAVGKLTMVDQVIEGTTSLGYPADVIRPLGVLQLICLLVYLHPRTAALGAVLWTGYLGGAIATHVRMSAPLFTHQLFPLYVAAMLWGGLWLRSQRFRAALALVFGK